MRKPIRHNLMAYLNEVCPPSLEPLPLFFEHYIRSASIGTKDFHKDLRVGASPSDVTCVYRHLIGDTYRQTGRKGRVYDVVMKVFTEVFHV